MNLIDKVIMALECSEVYAQKVIDSCSNEKEVGELIAWKLEEKRERKGIVEYV